jgi:hypothetical protein
MTEQSEDTVKGVERDEGTITHDSIRHGTPLTTLTVTGSGKEATWPSRC